MGAGGVTLAALEEIVQASSQNPPTCDWSGPFSARRAAPLVGRGRELATLRELWGSAVGGKGELAVIQGAPGLGKTYLLQHFLREVQEEAVILRHCCAPEQRWSSLELRRVLGQLRQVPALLQHLRQELAPQLGELARAFPELAQALALEAESAPTRPQVGPAGKQALLEALEALGRWERPVILVVDQAQWLDARSLGLLGRWAQSPSEKHMLVLLAYQTWEGGRALEELSAQWCSTTLALGPLSQGESQHLIMALLEEPGPSSVSRELARLGRGSPMLLMELLHGCLEQRFLEKAPEGWRWATPAPEEVPRLLWGVLLQNLPEAQQHLLLCGAVLGTRFSVERAAALASMPLRVARRGLEVARARHLLRATDTEHLSFAHDSRRQALLLQLAPPRRRALHAQAAKLLEAHGGEALEIGEHLFQARQWNRAWERSLEGARRAHGQLLFERAAQGYQRALQALQEIGREPDFETLAGATEVSLKCGTLDRTRRLLQRAQEKARGDSERATLLQLKGELAFRHGDPRTAMEALQGALTLRGLRPPRSRVAVLVTVAALAARLLWRRVRAALLGPARTPARTPASSPEQRRLLFALLMRYAYAIWFAHGGVQIIWVLLRQMELAQDLPECRERALLLMNQGTMHTQLARHEEAAALTRQAVAMQQRLRDPHGEGLAQNRLCFALYNAGQIPEAIECGRRAARLLEQAGDPNEVIAALHFTGLALVQQGRLREALHCAQSFQNHPTTRQDITSWARALDLWSRATGGELPEGWLKGAMVHYRPWPRLLLRVAHAEALRQLRQEDAAGALRSLEEALGAQRLNRSSLVAACVTLRARAIRLSQSTTAPPAGWARAVEQALHWGRRYPCYLPQALREKAWWQASGHAPGAARSSLEEALAVARRQQQSQEEALTLETWGQLGLLCGWEGAEGLLRRGRQQLEAYAEQLEAHRFTLHPPGWARGQGPGA